MSALGVLGCSEGQGAQQAPQRTGPHLRVVSLTPATSTIIEMLGAHQNLVGVTRYCNVVDVPIVGDMHPDPTLVLARTPDLVVVGGYPSQVPTREALGALGANVLALDLVTLGDMRRAVTTLGARLDRESAAATLVKSVDDALVDARTRAKKRGPLRILWVYAVDRGTVITSGGGDHLSEVLDAVGAVNVAQGGPLTARLPLETVIAKGPDVIVHAAPNAAFPDDAAAQAFWSHLGDIPAVHGGHVFVWPDDNFAQNSPRIAAAITALSDRLDAVRQARP
ncbi:MAG: ABC-type Fe3+-hydroxamate transport system substrate-binding protein [Myxococcota bacterium]|jgi:ABC-type Fe3+-hydroxamate transport system substrate-binding protein